MKIIVMSAEHLKATIKALNIAKVQCETFLTYHPDFEPVQQEHSDYTDALLTCIDALAPYSDEQ